MGQKDEEGTSEARPGRYGIEAALTLSWLKPRYWKTMGGLAGVKPPEVSFDGTRLRIEKYPFEPSLAYPSKGIDAAEVAEVVLGWPPEVRLKQGDIVFVPASAKEALVSFAYRFDIALTRRRSVWGELLDPFLDTWAEQAAIDRQFAQLAQLGLTRKEVDHLRREVAPAMVAYNFGTGLWEWAGLSLYDVLSAQRASLDRVRFQDFYERALKIARLDPLSPERAREAKEPLKSALHSVLLDWFPALEEGSLKTFQSRWNKRSDAIGRRVAELVSELTQAYGEAHRHYHSLVHVESCLGLLQAWWDYAVRLNEVRWALIFHDAIYDPQRSDNESRSADWACRIMDEFGRPADEIARVRDLILATRHAGELKTPDQSLLVDIDLSILGAPEVEFAQYDSDVRKEYAWVPEPAYQSGRTAVLRSFLERPRIFSIRAFAERYEAQARGNIQSAISRLRPDAV